MYGDLPVGAAGATALGDSHVVEDGEGLCQLRLQLDQAVRLLGIGGRPLALGGGRRRGAPAPLQEAKGLGEILLQLRGLGWIHCLGKYWVFESFEDNAATE